MENNSQTITFRAWCHLCHRNCAHGPRQPSKEYGHHPNDMGILDSSQSVLVFNVLRRIEKIRFGIEVRFPVGANGDIRNICFTAMIACSDVGSSAFGHSLDA